MEWEFAILDWLQMFQTPVLTKILAFVTALGEAGWFWIVLGVGLLCTKRYRAVGTAVLLALTIDFILANLILKPLVARPRPCWIRDSVELFVRVPGDYSFPSGHTMASFASAGALFLTKRKWGIWALVLSVLMGISRLYFYVHFPTDVLAGAVLGLFCGYAGFYLMKKLRMTRLGKYYTRRIYGESENQDDCH